MDLFLAILISWLSYWLATIFIWFAEGRFA